MRIFLVFPMQYISLISCCFKFQAFLQLSGFFLGLKYQMSNSSKKMDKNYECKLLKKRIVSWTSVVNNLLTVIDSAFNCIFFKKKLHSKFREKLK